VAGGQGNTASVTKSAPPKGRNGPGAFWLVVAVVLLLLLAGSAALALFGVISWTEFLIPVAVITAIAAVIVIGKR
jgi:hypothetical protein